MVAVTDIFLFANNKTASLNNDVLAGDGSIVLAVGEGAGFPSPTTGQFFAVTLHNTQNGDVEVCYCTARAGDVLGVERAREGTTALGFPTAYTTVQMRPTKGILEKFLQVRFTAADVDKYLKIQSTGLVTAAAAEFQVPAGISYLAVNESHTAGKATAEVAITSAAGVATLDPTLSNCFNLELTENVVLTLNNGQSGQLLSLIVYQNGTGGYTLSFAGTNHLQATDLSPFVVSTDPNALDHISLRWSVFHNKWLIVPVQAFV